VSEFGGSTRLMGGTRRVVSVGLRRQPLKDLYHHLLVASWARIFLLFGLVYAGVAGLFAVAYFFLAAGIENARPGSYLDAFFFSLQTLSETSYRPMAAKTVAVELLTGLEGFLRWLGLALGAGLIFAKFSSPRPRVLFSRVAAVAPHPGGRALMFRMANERSSHLVDAKLRVLLVRDEAAGEGVAVRRAHDLPLWRGDSALFTHAWTAMHLLSPESPLALESAESLERSGAELIVSLTGFDEALSRTVHARHLYRAEQILWNVRFREIVKALPNGVHRVDYRRFHDVEPVEETPRPERVSRRARG
jgi:inward rectifier potassium channel